MSIKNDGKFEEVLQTNTLLLKNVTKPHAEINIPVITKVASRQHVNMYVVALYEVHVYSRPRISKQSFVSLDFSKQQHINVTIK